MSLLFDTHAHYTDERLSGENGEAFINESFSGGIGAITCVGASLEDSYNCIKLASRYKNMFAACGIHPHECEKYKLDDAMNVLEGMLKSEKVVALGEIGLDYYYDTAFKQLQLEFFDAQLSLAGRLGIPVIIHDRDAHGDTFEMIKSHPGVRGIIHSCSCGDELVKQYVRLGWYISFSGVITFKNASKILESVKAVPDDRLLLETDCPYLAPVPMRGKTNYSLYMKYTAEKAAEVRGVPYEYICKTTFENSCKIYGINL